MTETSGAGTDKDRARLARMVNDKLHGGEKILAILPFTQTSKRPKAPGEKRSDRVTTGVYQFVKRYRPLVVTDQRLFVFDAGRTAAPRAILAEFPVDEVEVGDITPGNFGMSRFVLDLPGLGRVPFEGGRKEQHEVQNLRELLGTA